MFGMAGMKSYDSVGVTLQAFHDIGLPWLSYRPSASVRIAAMSAEAAMDDATRKQNYKIGR
jgi:hypothetical protein